MAGNESDIAKIFLEAEKARLERLEAETKVFELPTWEATDAEGYLQALPPKQALARLPYEASIAIPQLQRELQYERVKAVCDEAYVLDGERSYRIPYGVVQSWHWWKQMPKEDDAFWLTGFLECYIPEKTGPYHIGTRGQIRYFGVRFWPDGLLSDPTDAQSTSPQARLSAPDEATAVEPPALAHERSPPSAAELGRIAQAVAAGWGPTFSETTAWEYAKAHWPEYKIAKHRFLEQYRIFRATKIAENRH